MDVREYRPGDEKFIEIRPFDLIFNDHAGMAAVAQLSKWSYTALMETPVMLFGASEQWKGVAHAWFAAGQAIRGHGLSVVKIVRATLDAVAEQNGLRRYNTLVHGKSLENIRFAKVVGFDYEFTMYGGAPDGSNLLGMVYWKKGDKP